MTYIFRVVPHGMPAAGCGDDYDDDCDLDAPHDLVLLTETVDAAGLREQVERERTPYPSGYEASRALAEMVRR